jgi:hypothetical protein
MSIVSIATKHFIQLAGLVVGKETDDDEMFIPYRSFKENK